MHYRTIVLHNDGLVAGFALQFGHRLDLLSGCDMRAESNCRDSLGDHGDLRGMACEGSEAPAADVRSANAVSATTLHAWCVCAQKCHFMDHWPRGIQFCQRSNPSPMRELL
jgi:hypothetical protein